MENQVSLRFLRFSFVLLAAFSGLVHGASCPVAASGPATVSVIELYTSEGCDSCPPADQWFSTLSFAGDHVVPLAFHVDYWDYIGWKDPFGQAGFAERQRLSVTRQGSRTVYTPQLLFDGHDARGITGKLPEVVRAALQNRARANLRLQSGLRADALEIDVDVAIEDASLRRQSALYLALTENHLSSRVTAGENRGATLRHDHVVRELVGPIPLHADGALQIHRALALKPDWKRGDLEVAAFVQNEKNGDILQALVAPTCP